jgi:hypothetical protein
LSSACRACFFPVLACRGSWSVAGGLTSLYVRLGYPWQALALLACRGFLAPVFTLSRVAVCRCCRFCRFVCVCDCVAVCVCPYRWQALALSRFRVAFVPVRLSGFRTSVRQGAFEQVFETSVRQSIWVSLSEFPTESNRIFANRILSFFNRILTEFLLWVFNRIFDWLVASSGVA